MKYFNVLKRAATDFLDDECMVSGASLAYYTIFSLPPLLVVVFYIAGMAGVKEETLSKVISDQIGLPVASVTQSGEESNDDSNNEPQQEETDEEEAEGEGSIMASFGPLAKIVGALLLVFSATGVFAQLQRALNRAWEVEPDPEKGSWYSFLAKRGLSLGMVVVIAFLLLVSFVLTTGVDEMVKWVTGSATDGLGLTIGIVLNNVVILILSTFLFAAMFKILPDADMRWKDLWIGAAMTSLLFVIGKASLGWYLQNSSVGSEWGSAATSMIAMLVWVYYTSLIVLFGAELTQAWVDEFGAGISPSEGAVRVVETKEHVREEAESVG